LSLLLALHSRAFVFPFPDTSLAKAGADLHTARELATRIEEEFAPREKANTEELRSRVLELLKERDLKVYENWLVYDRAVKKRET
ncbi:MAG: hypothetical protein QXI93_01705, partial [Candidatus Methanomethylicia archaeon]